jgi:hypothetical protein
MIKTGHAARAHGTYAEHVHNSEFRECPNCRRGVLLNREGCYRRHFATEPDGRLHLCATSGHAPAELVPRALDRLDL